MSSVEVAQRFFEEFPVYSEYKDSGIDWLGEIPKHWEVTKLKYVTEINTDTLPENTDPTYLLNYLDIGNVNTQGEIIEVQELNFKDSPSRARRVVNQGDTAISTVRTYLRAIVFIDQPPKNLIVSTGFAVLRPTVELYPKFLFRLVQSQQFIDTVVALSTGVSYPAITPYQLAALAVWLPTFQEQKQIATFLDRATTEIDQIIEQQKQLITLLQEERTTVISQAVTRGLDPSVPMKDSGIEWLGEIPKHWAVKRLKWLVLQIGSGKTPKGGSEIYSDSGVIFIRSQNVHFDSLRLDDVVYINESIDIEMASTRVLPQDVLLNITGASLGRCNIVPKSFPAANVNQHVCIIRPNPAKIDPEFLQNSISSNIVQGQIFAGENGTSRESLTFPQIANFVLVAPKDLEEQQKIVSFIQKETARIDEAIENVRSQIEKLEEYRTVLISDAVTGKIDIRRFNKE